MTNKLSLVPIILVCLFLSPIVGADAQTTHTSPNDIPSPMMDAFSPAEWTQMSSIGERLQGTQILSDPNMDFVSRLLHTPPPLNTLQAKEKWQRVVLGKLISSRPKVLTPAQRKHLFNVVLPYTDSPNPVVRTNAMIVLASSRDPRATTVLERHVKSDTNPQNRIIAAESLKRLQTILKQPAAK